MQQINNLDICIVIPIHKPNLDPYEVISLNRCLDILNDYNIFILTNYSDDIKQYIKINKKKYTFIFAYNWLNGIDSYNKMKIDIRFYELFNDYKYLLTYELDSYVFEDKLGYYCNLGYDFIGSPFFQNLSYSSPGQNVVEGMNSGFSLRNIDSIKSVLGKLKCHIFIAKIINKLYFGHLIRGHVFIEKLFGVKMYNIRLLRAFLNHNYIHEDVFWTNYVPKVFEEFILPDSIIAIGFGFDANPKECFKLNNSKLPFGCHAWNRNLIFWDKYIS